SKVVQRDAQWAYNCRNQTTPPPGSYGRVTTNNGRVTYNASVPWSRERRPLWWLTSCAMCAVSHTAKWVGQRCLTTAEPSGRCNRIVTYVRRGQCPGR